MQEIKSKLRTEARAKRKLIYEKSSLDETIAKSLLNLDEYKKAKTVLIYVSLDDEIKTDEIISVSLADGKRVAVPFCRDKFGNMDFYLIDSFSQLESGSFNVREPKIDECEKLTDFSDSIIIVPGMLFNINGFRIGYGKGYYDKFLGKYSGKSIGLCYDEMIVSDIPHDKYDKSVDLIVTQSGVINCNNGGRNGQFCI